MVDEVHASNVGAVSRDLLHLPILVEVILLRGKELVDEELDIFLPVVYPPEGVAEPIAFRQSRQIWEAEKKFGLGLSSHGSKE